MNERSPSISADTANSDAPPDSTDAVRATDERSRVTDAMTRTAFQRKAVSRQSSKAVLDDAVTFFTVRGYRSGRTGRPNQVFVMGAREGVLPRVTAEILAQAGVGKSKTTLITISGFGEQLSAHLKEYVAHLRTLGKQAPPGVTDATTKSNRTD